MSEEEIAMVLTMDTVDSWYIVTKSKTVVGDHHCAVAENRYGYLRPRRHNNFLRFFQCHTYA